MGDENPLIQSTVSTSPSTMIRRFENGDPLQSLARVWSCSRCGGLLGVVHLGLGVIIALFDMLTSPLSNTSYAISAAILYILCAILCFIATLRVDRCTQLLLMVFATGALIISSLIFLESAITLNKFCHPERCEDPKLVVQSVLVVISLSEFLASFITLVVCFRSLHGAVAVNRANSPYSTLIIGDYSQLQRPARIFCPRFHSPQRKSTLPARLRAGGVKWTSADSNKY